MLLPRSPGHITMHAHNDWAFSIRSFFRLLQASSDWQVKSIRYAKHCLASLIEHSSSVGNTVLHTVGVTLHFTKLPLGQLAKHQRCRRSTSNKMASWAVCRGQWPDDWVKGPPIEVLQSRAQLSERNFYYSIGIIMLNNYWARKIWINSRMKLIIVLKANQDSNETAWNCITIIVS